MCLLIFILKDILSDPGKCELYLLHLGIKKTGI